MIEVGVLGPPGQTPVSEPRESVALPIRIYALAKQLNLENKVLVDLCKRLGIKGKGSALASLSEEEVAQINEHLGASKKSASTGATPVRKAPAAGTAYLPFNETREFP